jgi:hypothetical protein
MPFVKHCTVSAFSSGAADAKKVWVLDGINNEGFSGGPVVFGTGTQQKLLAVISGFHTEPVEVVRLATSKSGPKNNHHDVPSDQPVDTPSRNREKVDVNSGFILAFDISYAIDAIKKNPIGPLRAPN